MTPDYKEKLTSFYQSNRRMPTYTEMMKLFGFKSKNAVYRVVTKLIAAGIVTKDKLGKLIPSGSFNEIPMVGFVKAGLPAPGEVLDDTVNLEEYLVPKKASTYLFEVDGESMIEAHIADGDMVIAERTNTAKDGDIVIAQVDGEFTMKYLRNKNGKLWLEPANKHFKPIYPEYELTIVAVVRGVVRKY
ncbi:MAG TPA: transcriptional repressor LexA [Candidatus Paceibacterota bacterium]|jgi:repressor LexA|nr:transcriptional repressor LexA [Candidatus Paceibacterota bacterium]